MLTICTLLYHRSLECFLLQSWNSIPTEQQILFTFPLIPGNHHSSLYLRVWLLVLWSLSRVQLFATPWITARQAPLSSTIFQSLLKFMSVELVMLFNHLTLCHLLLLPSTFPSIRVFSSELALCIGWPQYWSVSFSISPSSEYSGLISLLSKRLKSLLQHHSSKASILQCYAFFMVQLSHLYMTTTSHCRAVKEAWRKTIINCHENKGRED